MERGFISFYKLKLEHKWKFIKRGDGMRTTRTKRTKTDLKFKFVLANPMTGKVKKSVFHPSSHSINKYFVV